MQVAKWQKRNKFKTKNKKGRRERNTGCYITIMNYNDDDDSGVAWQIVIVQKRFMSRNS